MPTIAEGLGVLTIAADFVMGRPKGSGLSAAIMAAEFAKKLGLDPTGQKDAFFLASVRLIGCTSTSHENGLLALGDDQSLFGTAIADWTDMDDMKAHLDRFFAPEAPAAARENAIKLICDFLPKAAPDLAATHCRQAYLLARRLPVSSRVLEGIAFYYARYDGKIWSFGGEGIPYLSRLVRITEMAEAARQLENASRAKQIVQAKLGHELDPAIGKIFLEHADEIFEAASKTPIFEAFVAAEPGEPIIMTPTCRQVLAEVVADMCDQKALHFLGHSRRVAGLVAAAAQVASLPADQVEMLRLAGLVHDVGKCAVSNRIWYKGDELTRSERLEMESHSFQTEWMLSHGQPFCDWVHLASAVHERADASGYHRKISISDLQRNILAVANEYDELTHATPARKALTPAKTADILNRAAAERTFLPTAVMAVLQAAGHQAMVTRAALPFGLTRREAQVLTRLAKSETTAEIAEALGISPKTADHHIQNIYTKTDTRSRPAIALLALEHGIVAD